MSKDKRPLMDRYDRDRVYKDGNYWYAFAANHEQIFKLRSCDNYNACRSEDTHSEAIRALDVARGRVKP